MEERANGSGPFLWVDEAPDRARRVREGEILVASGEPPAVSKGLIHHWVGAVFLPGVSLDQMACTLDDYDRYADFYRPLVMKSQVLERTSEHEKVRLLMMQRAFGVTAAVETDDEIRLIKLDASRIYSVSSSIRVQEIADYGQQNERLLPEDQGPGYVWRTAEITRIEQRDGGVYVEIETIALSRGIPWEFRWLVKPLTERLPRNIMFETLKDTRSAVSEEAERTSGQDQKSVQKACAVELAAAARRGAGRNTSYEPARTRQAFANLK
jgi:hypothetical protein